MVSDIVLLRELPELIKNSIESYIGCVSGAIKKDKYIKEIRAAGFKEVNIIDETFFPIESIMDGSTAKTIMKTLEMSSEEAKRIANSVISIKVSASKSV